MNTFAAKPERAHTRLAELPALTGLRGFAALWVYLYHLWAFSGGPELQPWAALPPFKIPLTFGWSGVDLFFCLSAFLLALPYAQWRLRMGPRPDTSQYLLRRVLRIYPAYLVQLAILLALAFAFGIGHTLTARELIAHLFLWFNMKPDNVAPLVGVWFTLPIEFSFYLLLPFLAPLMDRRRWPWLLLGAIAVTVAYRLFAFSIAAGDTVPQRVIEVERLPGRIDQFVIAMLAGSAFVALRSRGWRPASPGWWFAIGCAGYAVMCWALLMAADVYWEGHPLLYFWHGAVSLCLVPVLLSAAWESRPARALLSNPPMRFLGETSYGLYLWHLPIILGLAALLPGGWDPTHRFGFLALTATPLSLLAGHLSYVLIERPMLRIGRKQSAHPGLETPLADRG